MPDLAAVRAAIVATLQGIQGFGPVHDFERFAKDEKTFRELYKSGDRILGWHVRRRATRETSAVVGAWKVVHEWRINGFLALNDADATELEFDALIEAGRDAIRADDTLGGVVTATSPSDDEDAPVGMQLLDSAPVMFCGVLCHRAQLQLFTRHYL